MVVQRSSSRVHKKYGVWWRLVLENQNAFKHEAWLVFSFVPPHSNHSSVLLLVSFPREKRENGPKTFNAVNPLFLRRVQGNQCRKVCRAGVGVRSWRSRDYDCSLAQSFDRVAAGFLYSWLSESPPPPQLSRQFPSFSRIDFLSDRYPNRSSGIRS